MKRSAAPEAGPSPGNCMGLLMSGQVSLLCKFFAAFLTGEHHHDLSKAQNANDDSGTVYIVRTRT
jgi:hypothetical protein